jgi:RHS repeat-associated protein
VDTGLYNYGARYYNPAIGRFASQDPAFLNLTHLELQLVDPQSWNSYAYARNNPLAFMDPDGNMWTPWQSSGSFGNWVGNGAYLHNMFGGNADRISVQVNDIRANGFNSQNVGAIAKETGGIALKTGAVIGGSLAIGATGGLAVNALTPAAATTATTVGTACAGGGCQKAQEVAPKIANGLRLGQNIPSLGRVIENAPGKINGFNHDGSFHGIDQVITRGVSPQSLLNTVQNPLATFSGRFDRTGYLSQQAYVVLDKGGQVVTSWTNNQFGSTTKNVLNSIKP